MNVVTLNLMSLGWAQEWRARARCAGVAPRSILHSFLVAATVATIMTPRAKKIVDFGEDYEVPPPENTHVPRFVTQLFKMVNRGPASMISWSGSGESFIVAESIQTFECTLLPRYFRHRRVSSFIRQLHLYGFRKIGTDWIYKHDMFHRDRPENLHLVRRVSGVDGRKCRFNLLPAGTTTETNENDAADGSIEITSANIKKNPHSMVSTRTNRAKNRFVCDDLTNIDVISTHAKASRFTTKVQSVPHGTSDANPMTNGKKAAPFTACNMIDSRRIPYKQSTRFLAGTLLTYDDVIDPTPGARDDPTTIGSDPKKQESPKPPVVSFYPSVSSNLRNRMALMIPWPRPGYSEYDSLLASLAVFALEGFAGKRGLCAGVKSYLTLFPAFANDFHHYDCALRGTSSYLIIEGTLQFNCSEESTRYADMIHDFATLAANRLLCHPGFDKSLLSDEDIALFRSVVTDWKEAVHLMF